MMLLNDEFTLLCIQDLVDVVVAASTELRPYRMHKNVVLLAGSVNAAALQRSGIATRRFMDHYCIAYWPSYSLSLTAPESVLFDLLADHYEQSIDTANNIANIRILISLVKGAQNQPCILDYGCGTGLSRRVAPGLGVRILGYDRSSAMLAVARKHGLTALDLEQLRAWPDSSLDGLIASYVFHLATARGELEVAARKLRQGARLAANFHKELGIREVSVLLQSIGFRPELVPRNPNDQTILVWVRDET